MSDGSLISVEHSHEKTAGEAGSTWKGVFASGGLSGYIFNKELGVHSERNPNDEQIKTMINLYYKYHLKVLYMDVEDNPIVSRIKNAEHLEALLRYGKEFVSESLGKKDILLKERSER